jgi:hypothetical protein
MATYGTDAVTLQQWASHLAPDNTIAKIVEVLAKTNEMVGDIPFKAANLPTGHRTVRRLTLPTGSWRMFNQGVGAEVERVEVVTDTISMLESYNDIDKSLYTLNGQSQAWRWQKDKAFLEGMTQTVATAIIYSDDVADPEKFKGLAKRYPLIASTNTVEASTAGNATNSSMYLCSWGDAMYGIYPPGSNAGIQLNDLGEVTNTAAHPGAMYQVVRSHFKWDLGIVIEDPRACVRICNINIAQVATATPNTPTVPDLCDSMIDALSKIPKSITGTKVFYCNATVWAWLTRQMSKRSNLWWKPADSQFGEPVMMFNNVPIKQCDALLDTEAAVV